MALITNPANGLVATTLPFPPFLVHPGINPVARWPTHDSAASADSTNLYGFAPVRSQDLCLLPLHQALSITRHHVLGRILMAIRANMVRQFADHDGSVRTVVQKSISNRLSAFAFAG